MIPSLGGTIPYIIIISALLGLAAVVIVVKRLHGADRLGRHSMGQSISVADAHFTQLTGALKIGSETISYYSYANDQELQARLEARLKEGLAARMPASQSDGKVMRVETTLRGWRIFKAIIIMIAISVVVLYVWRGVLLPDEQRARMFVGSALVAAYVLHALLGTLYDSMLNRKWSLVSEHISIGKWKLKEEIPVRRIAALKIEIAREKLRKQARQPGFILEVSYDDRYVRFHDMRLGKILPLYDAIIARRPDLKIA